jgi:hypothetical protein
MGRVTVPNTPAGSEAGANEPHNPFAPPPLADPAGLPTAEPARESRPSLPERLLPELLFGLGITAAGAVLGVLLGLLWLWLAPRVMFQVSGGQILYVDPEGEQRAGADSVFALLALGIGALTAIVAFLLTRRRGGGVAVAIGLALGGVAGSLIAWKLGTALGPTSDLIGHAKQVGDGGRFSASLELGSYGALLVWPMTALVVLLALSAAFGKREEDPPPYWASTAVPPVEPAVSVESAEPTDRPEEQDR